MSSPYVKVKVYLSSVLPNSCWIRKHEAGKDMPLARSLIYGPDELRLERMPRDELVTLRIMAWKAREFRL